MTTGIILVIYREMLALKKLMASGENEGEVLRDTSVGEIAKGPTSA